MAEKQTDAEVVFAGNGTPEKQKNAPSQGELEHRVYLRVNEKYEEYERKRKLYRLFGILGIIVSGLVFFTLAFRQEDKTVFLILWIGVILGCVALMLRGDYMWHMYGEMLELTEDSGHGNEEEETETEQTAPTPPPESKPQKGGISLEKTPKSL